MNITILSDSRIDHFYLVLYSFLLEAASTAGP